jgi:hypothetical protein
MSKPFIAERKPIEVIALRYDEETNLGNFLELLKSNKSEPVRYNGKNKTIYIKKERGEIELTLGNWVIYETNTDKSFWAIDHDIFLKTYELVSLADNKYRKGVYQVEVCEFTSLETEDILDLIDFVGIQERGEVVCGIDKDELVNSVQSKGFLLIDTLEGLEKIFPREFLIKGVEGEFYPVQLQNFWKVYKQLEKE